MLAHHLGFLSRESVGYKGRVDEHVPTRPENPERFAECCLKVVFLRVNSRSEILPTYRVITPEVCATPSSVGAAGIEPATPRV